MKRRFILFITTILIFILTACSAGLSGSVIDTSVSQTANTTTVQVSEVIDTSSTTSGTTSSTSASASVVTSGTAADSAASRETHEDADDYVYDEASAVAITLNGSSIMASSTDVTVEGSKATITAPGTYILSGSLSDGQILVNASEKGVVRLVLNGVEIQSSDSAPIYVQDADEVVIILADNTQNTLTDGTTYTYTLPDEEEPNAAIFSKSDLSIAGNGALTVNANFNDGINSTDGLIIAGGTITVNAADDGIRGKDYLVIENGSLTVNAQGDGLKSDNDEDASRGYISIEAGTVTINAGGDAINAQTDVLIQDGTFDLTTTGQASDDTSTKGIKGGTSVMIDGGTFTINTVDDSIHSNGSIIINDGTFNLASADDGMHADQALTVNDGTINVVQSYEGLESAVITINSGNIRVTASDDGINVAGGVDGSGFGQDMFANTGSNYLYINGGYVYVDAGGDGIDVGGTIEMSDGVVVVNGPTEQMDGALDYDVDFIMTGGFIVAAGSSGMAEVPGASSSQLSMLVYLTASQSAGTLIHIQNSAGEDVLTFAPAKTYQSVAFSSPELENGETYTIYTGGSATGTAIDGLYQDGTYTAGNQEATATISSTVTTVGSGGQMMGGGRGIRP